MQIDVQFSTLFIFLAGFLIGFLAGTLSVWVIILTMHLIPKFQSFYSLLRFWHRMKKEGKELEEAINMHKKHNEICIRNIMKPF